MSGLAFDDPALFTLGPVSFTSTMATSAAISAALILGSHLVTRRLDRLPGRLQALLELAVTTIDDRVQEATGRRSPAMVAFLGTLFLFIAAANLSAAVPGLKPPTERIETPLALALLVFLSVHVFGVGARGLRGHLRHYLEPSALLAPLHALSEVTRTFSLTMRLFGNMASHGLVLAVVLGLAKLLVPIPILALGLLTGVIQAYIFTVLATNYVAAAVASQEPRQGRSS